MRGTATRSVPPQDEMLAFFGYSDSPFYATLPAAAAAADDEGPDAADDGAAGDDAAGSDGGVLWLDGRGAGKLCPCVPKRT